MNRLKPFGELVAAALISGAFVSAVAGVLFTGYVTRTAEEIRSQRSWKEHSVAELLGPLNIQFDRTKRAFERWEKQNLYLEAKVVKVGNETIRDLLLSKGHLIPPELLDDAGKLVEHYDVWLEIFERKRAGESPDLKSTFVFAGPEGYLFPRDAEMRFRQAYHKHWNELYGQH
jgi:hypothetical protein